MEKNDSRHQHFYQCTYASTIQTCYLAVLKGDLAGEKPYDL